MEKFMDILDVITFTGMVLTIVIGIPAYVISLLINLHI